MDFSPDNWKELVQNFPEPLLLIDSNGYIKKVNDSARQLLGWDKKHLPDLKIDDLEPESTSTLSPDRIEEIVDKEEPLVTTVRKNNTKMPVELKARRVKIDGRERFLTSIRELSRTDEPKNKHKIVTEGSSQAIYLFQDGEFKFVNESFENLTGYTEEELNNMNFLELIHPEFREKIEKWTRQALAGNDSGLPDRVEYKILTKEGETLWARSLPSVTEYRGKPAIVGNAVDITTEKLMEEELRQEKTLIESIMTLTPDLVYFKDNKHRFERVCEKYTDLLNTEEEKMLGKTVESFWPESEEILEDEKGVLTGEPIIGKERKVTLPNGDSRWFSINKVPRRDTEGNIIGLLGMDRDITDRKEMEKELNRRKKEMSILLSNLPGMAYKCKNDKDWTMKFVSEGCKDLTGYEPEELIDNRIASYGDLILDEDRGRVWKSIQEQLNSQFQYELEYRLRTKNGKIKWVWEQGRKVLDSKNNLKNLQGFVADITKRKRVEQSLDEERNKLKNLHQAVDILQQQNTEEEVLNAAVDVLENMLNFELCTIATLEGDCLVPKVHSTKLDPEKTKKITLGEGIAGKTLEKGETIWVNDVKNFPNASPASEDFQSFISTPLGDLGNLQVISKEAGSFTNQDVELVEIFGGHLREELKGVHLEEELRQQAIRDPLTNLYNRRYFNETLKKEIQKVKRYNEHLSFLMFDVDNFKKVNDFHSHQIGDKVLQKLADLLKENVRSADIVVRYGGDEFLVMMPKHKTR